MVQSHNLVVLALLLTAIGFVALQSGAIAITESPEEQYHPDRDVNLVEKDDDTALWPYTSRARAFQTRTLAINVVIYGDTQDVRRALLTQTDAEWNETTEELTDRDPVSETRPAERRTSSIDWESARGGTRYTYVADRSADGREPAGYWMASSAQFHDGDYFGSRHHLRVYDPLGPEREWVAIQAHQEHWDWFGLRHSVDSTEQARQRVEDDFMGRWFVDEVSREYYGTADALDTDGWVTEIRLRQIGGRSSGGEVPQRFDGPSPPGAVSAPPAFVGAAILLTVPAVFGSLLSIGHASRTVDRTREHLAQFTDTVDLRYLVLFGATLSVLLFVRTVGIQLEQTLVGVNPKLIMALVYPLVPIGIPLCAYVPARSLDELQSFVVASSGIGLGIMLDYALMGIAVLPVETLFHRLGVVLAVGLIAAGAAETTSPHDAWNVTLRAGVVLWLAAVLAPVIRWL